MRALLLNVVSLLILRYGNASTTTIAPPLQNTKGQPHCSKQGISCYDRHTIQYCSGVGDTGLEFTVSCKIQNPDRPFCVENENQVKCETEISTFVPREICNHKDVRPDPTNCSRYIQCVKNSNRTDYFGTIVNCPNGSIYSIDKHKCSIYIDSCITVHSDCVHNPDKLIAYKLDPSIYVKCPAINSKDKIIVKLCKNKYHFIEEIGTCVQICKQEGYMPSNENCKEFYNCVKTQPELFTDDNGFEYSCPLPNEDVLHFYPLTPTLNKCPTGTGFNRNTNLCDESEAGCSIKDSDNLEFDES